MSYHEDDVLGLDSESDFSGFDPVDGDQPPEVAKIVEVKAEEVVSPPEKRGKSPVKGKKIVKTSKKCKQKQKSSKKAKLF